MKSRSYGPGRYDPSYEEGGLDYPIGYVRWTEGRNLEAIVSLMAGGRLDVRPLITHRFPITQAAEAYTLITGKTGESFLGVLLTYPETAAGEGSLGEPLAAQAVAAHTAQGNGIPPVTSLRLGVLGAGNFASGVLLPAVRRLAGVQLQGIASAGGVSAQHAAQKFGFQYATSDETRILSDANINAVAILTRHHLHARQVLSALAAGQHVFCEKPLALTDAELDEIVAVLADSHSPRLMVGFNRRFAPLAVRLASFLVGRTEPLAAHYRVNAGYIPLNHWLHDLVQGGGRIIGEGCHFVDFLTFLVGAPPRLVRASGLPDHGRYREDNVVMEFSFPDGSLGTVSYLANGDKAFPKERLEVFCAGRAAVLDDFRSLEMVQDGHREVMRSTLRQDKGHTAEWQAFVASLATGGPPPIPYDQLMGVTRATFRAIEALRSGKTVTIG